MHSEPLAAMPPEAAGDRDVAVAALFRSYGAELVRLAYCLVGDRDLAEEAVQDACVSLHRHWNSLRGHGSSLAYLRVAVVNGCRSHQPRRVRLGSNWPWLAHAISPATGPDADVLAHDEALRIAAAIRVLPTRQREVLVCRCYLELSQGQTALLLDIPPGVVKRDLRRSLARVQDRMEDVAVNAAQARVSEALRRYAEGLAIDDVGQRRMEQELQQRITASRRDAADSPSRKRDPWQWAVGACALLGVVLGVLALWGERDRDLPAPAPQALAVSDLLGLWRTDDSSGALWEFHQDGTVAFSDAAADFFVPERQSRSFQVWDSGLREASPDGRCVERYAVARPRDGRLTVVSKGYDRADSCDLIHSPEEEWQLTRVSPPSGGAPSLSSAWPTFAPAPVSTLSLLDGTWLHADSGTVLVIQTDPRTSNRYLLDDDGDGMEDPDETGAVRLRPGGGVTLVPRGGRAGCFTQFATVISRGALLDTTLDALSCGRPGDTWAAWIRLED